MSIQSKLSVEIDRPIEQVFELANNDLVDWSLTCVEEELLDEGEVGIGTKFRLVTEEKRGKRTSRMEFQGTTTAWDPPLLSACLLQGQYFVIDVSYTFEDLGQDRTKVTQESLVEGKGILKVVFFLFGWAMKKQGCEAQQKELDSLRRYCESKEPGGA